MSSIVNYSLPTWNQSTNPLFESYRSFKSSNSFQRFKYGVGGSVYNAFKAIGYAFASLPRLFWNRLICSQQPNLYLSSSLVYFKLTWMCLKTLWNDQKTLEHLQELEAQACFAELLSLKQTPITIEIKGPEKSFLPLELMQRMEELFTVLPEKRQESFLRFVSHNSSFLAVDDRHTLVAAFLYKLSIQHGLVAAQATSIYQDILKKTAASAGRVLIIHGNQTMNFVRKEMLEQGALVLFAEEQFEPRLSEAAKRNYQEGLRLIEKDEQSYILLEKLNKVYVSPNDEWDTFHATLAEDLDFLLRLAPGKKTDKIGKFLTYACNHWYKKILSGMDVRNHLKQLTNLCNALERAPLHTALTLYLLSTISLSNLNDKWHQKLRECKGDLMQVLFHPDNMIPLSAIFIQFLTFCMHEQYWQDAVSLCDRIATHTQRLIPLSAKKLEGFQTAFETVWKDFPSAEHMDLCLSLYKLPPSVQVLLPRLMEWIPKAAQKAAENSAKQTEAGEEILALAIQKLTPATEDFKKQCFDGLRLAHRRQMARYQNACLKKILHHQLLLEKGLSNKQIVNIVDSLGQYPGPDPFTDHAEIYKEGLAIFKFAAQLPKGDAKLKETCFLYLKSKHCYHEAAKKEMSAEAKTLIATLISP